jgi:cohesin complex subunit SA-1/2
MSSVAADSEAGDATTTTSSARRKSGRVTKKPEKFAPVASKRKRGDDHDSGVDGEGTSGDDEDESTEGEPDEEELRERRRKSKGKGKGKAPAKRSAAKKPRTNGKSVTLAMRPAGGASKKPSRPRKMPVRKSILAGDETTGLYGKQRPE